LPAKPAAQGVRVSQAKLFLVFFFAGNTAGFGAKFCAEHVKEMFSFYGT